MALFDRTGRGVQLTAAGEVLRDYALRSLALLEESRQAIADVAAGASGRLTLGAGVTTSIFHLPHWLQTFQQAFPAVEVAVRTGRSREVAEWVRARELEVGIVTSPVEGAEFRIVRLFAEEIALIVPPDHPFAGGEMPAEELPHVPLILFPSDSGFRCYLDRELAAAGISAQVKMETDSVEAIKSFVAIGLGASFLPASAVAVEISAGVLAQVVLTHFPPLQRSTSVLYRADRYRTRAMQGFLQVMSEG